MGVNKEKQSKLSPNENSPPAPPQDSSPPESPSPPSPPPSPPPEDSSPQPPPPSPPSPKTSPPPSPPSPKSSPPPSPPSPKSSPPPSSPPPSPPSPKPSPPPSPKPSPPPSPPNNSPPPSPPTTPPPPTPDTSKDTPPQQQFPPPPPPQDVPSAPPAGSPPLTPQPKEPPPGDNKQSPNGSPLVPYPNNAAPPGSSGGSSPSLLVPSTRDSSSNYSPSDTHSTSSSSTDSTTGSGNTSSMLVGGVFGIGVAVLVFATMCLVCSKRKKRKQHQDQYPTMPSQWNNRQQSMDHVIKFQSPPLQGIVGTPPRGGGGEYGMISGDYSVNNSGPYYQNVPNNPPPLGGLGGYSTQNQFSYQELASATSGFSQENLLGQGGFGYVHKGVLSDGREVAVKSLKSGSGQGEREFQAEVEIISRVHHRHLVSLVGYCIADGQRMLVYEFVPNKTLEHHLHGKGLPVMDWSSRIRIALGSAKGLAYLHEDCHPRIIHRDIKAANILLDENYEAMVADFGLAKLSSDNITHVSTRVMGTFGYLAPEYASSGKLSDKSDVFSFGVMLLELITGRRPVDPTGKIMEDSLVDWSRPLMTKALEDGNYGQIADPYMEGNYVPDEMARMVACANASVRYSAKRRPRMCQIVRSLEGDLAVEDLNDGVKHAINHTNNAPSPMSTTHDSTYDTGAYNADMMKFRKMVLNTQETPSGSGFETSDYGYESEEYTPTNY